MKDENYTNKVREAKLRAEKLNLGWEAYIHELDMLKESHQIEMDNVINHALDFFRDEPDLKNKIKEQFLPTKKQ